MVKISAVINTYNEEENVERAIKSIKWADEILVCDMYSSDKTVEIAKRLGAKVVYHKKTGFVEPARNFAISKASNEWVLLLDADEEIPPSLAEYIQKLPKEKESFNQLKIPRKNIIFNKWMKASMWWPDYHVRFFKKGTVEWNDKIHIQPKTTGESLELEPDEKFAIIHHHYTSLSQYLERMFRYTQIQAEELKKDGIKFHWSNLLEKTLSEFLSRFFANKGFTDGLHGLSLSLLQSFSMLLVYLKLWEMEGFKEEDLKLSEVRDRAHSGGNQINYWFKFVTLSKNPLKRFIQKGSNKFFS